MRQELGRKFMRLYQAFLVSFDSSNHCTIQFYCTTWNLPINPHSALEAVTPSHCTTQTLTQDVAAKAGIYASSHGRKTCRFAKACKRLLG